MARAESGGIVAIRQHPESEFLPVRVLTSNAGKRQVRQWMHIQLNDFKCILVFCVGIYKRYPMFLFLSNAVSAKNLEFRTAEQQIMLLVYLRYSSI